MQFFRTIMVIEFVNRVQNLNHLCWVTKISPRHVAFVMRLPIPNPKIKHDIYYDHEPFYSPGAEKLKLHGEVLQNK